MTEKLSPFDGEFVIFAKIYQTVGFPSESVRVTVFRYILNMYQIVFFLPHLLILVGGDCNELGLLEDVRPKGGVRQLENVVGPHQVEPRLVLVHRVEDGLQVPKRRGIKMG